jgi:hypothetical protein
MSVGLLRVAGGLCVLAALAGACLAADAGEIDRLVRDLASSEGSSRRAT